MVSGATCSRTMIMRLTSTSCQQQAVPAPELRKRRCRIYGFLRSFAVGAEEKATLRHFAPTRWKATRLVFIEALIPRTTVRSVGARGTTLLITRCLRADPNVFLQNLGRTLEKRHREDLPRDAPCLKLSRTPPLGSTRKTSSTRCSNLRSSPENASSSQSNLDPSELRSSI